MAVVEIAVDMLGRKAAIQVDMAGTAVSVLLAEATAGSTIVVFTVAIMIKWTGKARITTLDIEIIATLIATMEGTTKDELDTDKNVNGTNKPEMETWTVRDTGTERLSR